METRYPVRKADGKDFSRDEMQTLLRVLRQGKPGRWLAGANNMWHGGMHFSGEDVPWSVLTPDGGDGAVPLQCIADGELVAWRVCQDYVMGNVGEKPLQYSPSFLLVRSVHKPTKESSTWLCFYTLYMHLAPLSCYPKWKVYQVTPQGNGLIMRRHSGSEVPGQAAPPEIAHRDRLHHGEQVLIARQETFLLHNEQEEVFGLAQRLKDGVPVGDKFWMSVRPAFVEAVGEQYGHLPGWMAVALKAGPSDRVVCPSVMTGIRAGDAVGFLGKNDASDGFTNIMEEWFSHIEVMSNDGRMPLFLGNPGQLNTGRQYRTVPEGKQLYRREETESGPRLDEAGQTTAADAVEIIAQASATTATDRAGVVYLQLRSGQWIRQDETEGVSQHDLTRLKFHAVEQPPVHNMEHSLEEPWVVDSFRWLAQQLQDGRDQETVQMQAFYARMADEVEDGNIPAGALARYQSAIAHGLTHWNTDMDFFLRRLVVKHESEWYGDSSHPKWADVLAPMSGDNLACVKQWLDMHEWMSQVPEFSRDEAIWHFHPVEFMEAIGEAKRGWAHSTFANLIGNAESVNNYTAYNRTHPHLEVHTDPNLTSMTIAQVMTAMGRNEMFATGRFQITPPVLKEIVHGLKLDVNARYDEAMQDRMFEEYIIRLKRPPIIAYLEGNGSVEDAAYACAEEFASVGVQLGRPISPDPHEFERTPDGHLVKDRHNNPVHKKRHALQDGVSYYAGDGLNRALITPDAMIKALEASKNEGK